MARLYLIGAVSGKPDDNKAEFERVRRLLQERGHEVDIPHDFIFAGTPWDMAMAISINRITEYCYGFVYQLHYDGVAMLDDWTESSGANFERRLCKTIGMPCRSFREYL